MNKAQEDIKRLISVARKALDNAETRAKEAGYPAIAETLKKEQATLWMLETLGEAKCDASPMTGRITRPSDAPNPLNATDNRIY